MLYAGIRVHNHMQAICLELLNELPGQSAHGTGTSLSVVVDLAYGHQLDAILSHDHLFGNIRQGEILENGELLLSL